jgi:hypothetical protein
MPALGSATGPPAQSGRVASLYATGVTAATGASSTEGTNQLTYTCEKTGAYRVISYLRVNTAGTGASQSVVAKAAYNNGSTVAAANILPFIGAGTLTAFDLTAAAGTNAMAEQVVFGAVDTNIVINLTGSGTFTTAALIDIYFAIEAI